MNRPAFTYVGGPTALLRYGGLRFLTDPTFDPAGTEYPTAAYTLRKTQGPAEAAPDPAADVVLLSHDHHFDNLDHAGRALLASVPQVLTTMDGAVRLKGGAHGLAPWESIDLSAGDTAPVVRITATPARHGPEGGDRGPVIGFILQTADDSWPVTYFSGDTVLYDGVLEVGDRFRPDIAILNTGAARVAVAGPAPLTFTADEAAELATRWPRTIFLPLHYEGWQHFSEGRKEVERAFAQAGATDRLIWARGGQPLLIPLENG